MKKKIYISGKISNLPLHQVTMKFGLAQKEIEAFGFEVINPIEVVNDIKTTWENAIRKCIAALMQCDAIVMLNDWDQSPGAIIERKLAEDINMLIVTSDINGYSKLKKELLTNIPADYLDIKSAVDLINA